MKNQDKTFKIVKVRNGWVVVNYTTYRTDEDYLGVANDSSELGRVIAEQFEEEEPEAAPTSVN